jgi:hypothetical protein
MNDLWISVAAHWTAGGLEVGHRRAGQSQEVVERIEAMNDDQAELEEFGERWAGAELARDLTVLDMHLSPIAAPPGAAQQQEA